jgi:hypothetical protein
MLCAAAQVRLTVDVTEDGRNSFQQRSKAAATLRIPLLVTVHLAPEDPRLPTCNAMLGKLERAMPTSISLGGLQGSWSGSSEIYGEAECLWRSIRHQPFNESTGGPAAALRASQAFCLPCQRLAVNIRLSAGRQR